MTLLAPEQFAAFLAAAVLVTLSPGPDNLMVLSLGAARGRLPGMAFGLGCAMGCLSHTLLAAVGVSALIAASPLAFTALKIAGGLYLVRLGWLAHELAGSAGRDFEIEVNPLKLRQQGQGAVAVDARARIGQA